MKKSIKKILLLTSVLMALVFVLTSCGKEKELVQYDEAALKQTAFKITLLIDSVDREYLTKLENELSEEEIEEQLKSDRLGIKADGAAFYSAVDSWLTAKEELGNVDLEAVSEQDVTIEPDTDEVIVKVNVKGDGKDAKGVQRTAQVEYIFDKRLKLTSGVTNINRPMSENMQNAALNTVLGMGTVFAVLILIALLIYCFKYISVIEKHFESKKKAPAEKKQAIDNAVARIVETETRGDDTELIAVISAAIAAYESSRGASVPAGGYVVRSIKKR